MKKILQLLGILTFVICNYGNAKELKCEYELKNLNIEPVRVANAKRTYTVYNPVSIQAFITRVRQGGQYRCERQLPR